ncbi:MAG: bifunctional UDP-N-acetylmuramoyl-tripeptide:D-alanyl-D-alanine ligase/alanine racemase [Tannerella sp.]|jgi:alanine racemase|nr:bifunctional UDP-N-acetylmuramoyl-tripeptide:D-alanyl-D-alanine ligase/alanine racemase [Tannerella sp.]
MKYRITEIADIIEPLEAVLRNDCAIDYLLTDSRTLSFPESTLFFALKTSSNDGHKYVAEMYRLRVRNFVVARMSAEFKSMTEANFLVVENVLKALQQLAAHHRKQFDFPVIGITGSNGKTVVKELLYQILHDHFNIVRSPRSYNSQLGVPLSVWQMNGKHTLGIFEAGISQPDEMESLRRIIAPTIGILTNVGKAHQENFTSAAQKCLEKIALFNDCECIIYNADDEFISSALDTACLSHKGLGWSRTNSDAPIVVQSVERKENMTRIQCIMFGVPRLFEIPFTDEASIENVIHCIALTLYLKPIIFSKIQIFSELEAVAMRLEVKKGINNCLMINDTYNSDINSLDIALDFMQSRRGRKKLKSVVILSDILQTGILPKSLYKRVAELLHKKNADRLVGIGRDLKEHRAMFRMKSEFYLTTDEFLRSPSIKSFQNELILLKGARMFHFERITEQLEEKVHETILEVNLDALVHNYKYFRSRLQPETRITCMVKAFGYGAGAYELAKTLQDHHCDYLAVAVADEGRELRREGIAIPIMVMNPEPSSFNSLFESRLEPEVYCFKLLDALTKETEHRGITSYPVHIKIDTGMHRLGFHPDEIPELCRRLRNQSGLYACSVFSHLAGSDSPEHDDFTLQQIQTYEAAAAQLEKELDCTVIKHILNSAGIERFAAYQKDMVRLGIALYGISATGNSQQLQTVSSLKTTVLQIIRVPAGDSIGYGRNSRVSRDSRIASIPIGYADGLRRSLGNGNGEVVIHGKRCPIIGNICMDICMIDVTDSDAQEGDEVEIFGKQLPVTEVAEKAGTIPYEILTSISPRVKRVYYRE